MVELDAITDLDSLEKWRIQSLGRSGALTQLLRSVSELPLDQRKIVGSAANSAKIELEEKLHLRRYAIQSTDAKINLSLIHI